jgi:peptide-methionine (S)-S-oxide reductase
MPVFAPMRLLIAGAALVAGAWLATDVALGQTKAPPPGMAVATFAGGCFWCMEPPFDKLPGVISTTAGYTGGKTSSPTYEEVSSGATGHAEAVQIVYDPTKISYEKLLDVFWHNIDPTVKDRQFCDIGTQYRTAVFVHDDKQRQLAEASKAALEKSKPFKDPIVTPIVAASEFWPAEEYHQDYYIKNPVRYNYYRTGCGRDRRLAQLWGTSPH